MTRYVALFGAINVGGNRLSMADLRDVLEREDFEGVETVVASGNVLFDHEERPTEGLSEKLGYIVREAFGFDTFAVVLTRDALAAAIAENPFADDGEDKLVHTVFLSAPYDREELIFFAENYAGPERLAPGTHCFHIDYVEGVGRSLLDPAMRRAKLKLPRGTARNIRSLRRILAKMDS
ncbi:DUF1697 domain-containing protein [Alteraurantiacibacter palmitatis]|uniref:DUF1697 domain-containing protein n=1 Tax=Alteraurantiacibacter palmitatis TaxID=2054628 RepID=A0ABV7E880_9SPHN